MPSFYLQTNFPREVISTNRVRGYLLSTLQKLSEEVKNYFGDTLNFAGYGAPVPIKTDIRYTTGYALLHVEVENDLWNYLNYGTELRWAKMNYRFSPKTTPGTMDIGPGERTYNAKGYYTYIRGRRAMQERGIAPYPGIQGRHWDRIILREFGPLFNTRIEDAIRKGLGID